MDTKTCRICGVDKPLTEFHRRTSAKDGHHSACKPCAIAEQNRSRMKPPQFLIAYQPLEPLLKRCAHCKESKPFGEFVRNKNFWDGYNHICKACLYPQRVAYEKTPAGKERIKIGTRRRYGRNPEAPIIKIERAHNVPKGTYAALMELQDGKCAICEATVSVGGRRLGIDHRHDNGEVRGLLCTFCNQAIGQLQESPELFRKALSYLEKPPALHLSLTSSFQRKPDKG